MAFLRAYAVLEKDGAIPFPATFSMELGRILEGAPQHDQPRHAGRGPRHGSGRDGEPLANRVAQVGSGGFDVVADFAGRLPMDVISELLGVPAPDRATLRSWARVFSSCSPKILILCSALATPDYSLGSTGSLVSG